MAPCMKLCARYAAIPNCIRGYTMPLSLLRYRLSGGSLMSRDALYQS